MIDLGALKLSINVDSKQATKELNEFGDKSETSGSKFGNFIGKAKGLLVGGAIAAGVLKIAGAMKDQIKKTMEATDAIDKNSQKIGISKKGYQEWDHAFSQSGGSVDSMKVGMKTLIAQMDAAKNGTEKSAAAFKTLGISVTDSNGKLKDQEVIMNESMTALAGMGDTTERARLATELFGRAGSDMAPLLNEGTEGINALKQEANDLGMVMSDSTIKSGVVLGDTIENIKGAAGGVVNSVVGAMLPTIQKLADWIQTHMPQIKEVIGNVFNGVKEGVKNLKPVIDAIVDFVQVIVEQVQTKGTLLNQMFEYWVTYIKGFFKVIADIFKIFTDLFSGDTKALKQDFINLFTDIMSLLKNLISRFLSIGVTIITALWDGIKSLFGAMGKGIGDFFQDKIINPILNLRKKFVDAGAALFTGMWDGIKGVWDGIKNWVGDKVSWLVDKITFWDNGKKKVDGKHRVGLSDVPFDGYLAELHKGEMILSAGEANRYKDGTSTNAQATSTVIVNNYSPKALNESESARLFRQTQRELSYGF